MSAPATPSTTQSHSGTPTDPNKRRKIVSCLDCHSRKVKVSTFLELGTNKGPLGAERISFSKPGRANRSLWPICSAPRTVPCVRSALNVANKLLAPTRSPRTNWTKSIMLSSPPLLLPNVKPSRPSQFCSLRGCSTVHLTDIIHYTTESRLLPCPWRPSSRLRLPLQSLCQSLGARTTCSNETIRSSLCTWRTFQPWDTVVQWVVF
jgi:hypothetical protein